MNGLTGGEAVNGDHASLSVTPPDGVTFTSEAWGTSYGDDTFGTGTSPTDYTASHGNRLYWEGIGDDTLIYHASAPIPALVVTITGLLNGIAVIGFHASMGFDDAGTIDSPDSQEWGTTQDDDTYGTSAAPSDFEAGDGGNLVLSVTYGSTVVYDSAPIAYDVTAPDVTELAYNAGENEITLLTDEGGTAFYIVNQSAMPLAGSVIEDAVIATTPDAYGSFAVTVGENGETPDFSGVPAGTNYIHFTVKDAAGNYSSDDVAAFEWS
jgi:hypothetical protein